MKRFFFWFGLLLLLCLAVSAFWFRHFLPEYWRLFEPRVFHTVVIDAGHGGADSGAIGHGLMEKTLTLDVAQRLKQQLESVGLKVVMTRKDDQFLKLSERAQIGNRQRGSIFVSIHFNTSRSSQPQGVETYHYHPAEVVSEIRVAGEEDRPPTASEKLAAEIQLAVIARSAANDRGIKHGDFHVIRNARRAAVLVEGGFLSHRAEARLLRTEGYRDILTRGIAKGIVNYREQVDKQTKSRWSAVFGE